MCIPNQLYISHILFCISYPHKYNANDKTYDLNIHIHSLHCHAIFQCVIHEYCWIWCFPHLHTNKVDCYVCTKPNYMYPPFSLIPTVPLTYPNQLILHIACIYYSLYHLESLIFHRVVDMQNIVRVGGIDKT